MNLFKLSIQKDSQVTKLCLSVAAVIVAIPLALSAKVPARTSFPDSAAIKLAGRTAAPPIPDPINLRPVVAHRNSLIDNAFQGKLDAGQAARYVVQKILYKQSEAVWVPQKTQAKVVEAASPAVVTPVSTTTQVNRNPAAGVGSGKVSSSPAPTTTPERPTTPTTSPPSNTGTTPSTGSGATAIKDKTDRRPQRPTQTKQVQPRIQIPTPLRRPVQSLPAALLSIVYRNP